MKEKKKKNGKWIKFRHNIVRHLAFAVIYPYSKIKYGLRLKKIKLPKDKRYLVLYNHQTAFDQFFVGMPFKSHIYYVASEDLFSNGFVSSLIKYLVNPIPIKKQSTDVRAILNCMRVAKEGGSIAISPEGNRTYSGKTEYMNPSIAMLAKKLALPIALFRIEGGYGVHPRWSDVVRRGKMDCYVSRIIEPEEYKDLSNEELFEIIKEGLYVDETKSDAEFHHKKSAEYLERAIYICPECGLSRFESSGDEIKCKSCGLSARYTSKKEFVSENEKFPFKNVCEWYEYQKKFVLELDISKYFDSPVYEERASFKEVILCKKKLKIFDECRILLYGNRLEVGEGEGAMLLDFDDMSSVAVLGKNKINIYHKDKIYQIKGDKRFNALKFVNIYYRYVLYKKGDTESDFLGL